MLPSRGSDARVCVCVILCPQELIRSFPSEADVQVARAAYLRVHPPPHSESAPAEEAAAGAPESAPVAAPPLSNSERKTTRATPTHRQEVVAAREEVVARVDQGAAQEEVAAEKQRAQARPRTPGQGR